MTAPLRLLVVSHSLAGGGAERFAATLARHLDRSRFAPELVLAVDRRAYAVPDDVPVHTLGYRGFLSLPRTLARLRRLLRARRPRIVLSNVLSTSCLVGTARLGLPDPPAWVARVGLAPAEGDPPLQRAWARWLYPGAARLVGNSRGLAAALGDLHPALRDRVVAAPNPTDFAALDRDAAAEPCRRARSGEHTLLSLGRLVRQKRPDLAVETLAGAQATGTTRLWWAGEGPRAAATQRRARRLGVADRLDLLGFVPRPFSLVRQADLFLSTSDYEGLPNALIETQGLGLAAVATRCPFGPEEVVEHGKTGLLVAPGDRDDLVRAVRELLAAPERRQAFGAAAAERARARFGLAATLPSWQDLLEDAAGVPGRV